jgi:integrase
LKHCWQWRQTLTAHCKLIWDEPIDRVDTAGVLGCLGPIWDAKCETASRLRGRIERVLDAAKTRGLRSGENPAAWRGNLKALLPKRKRLTRGHQPALPYVEMPAFMAGLRGRDATAALALKFCILTATRTGATLGAEWKEIDLDAGLWVVPAPRMKVGKEHRIPLSKRALDNETPFAREIAEAALAHVIGDAAERAYRRGDALEKRPGDDGGVGATVRAKGGECAGVR